MLLWKELCEHLDSKMQEDVQERMKHTAAKIAEASNATAEVNLLILKHW